MPLSSHRHQSNASLKTSTAVAYGSLSVPLAAVGVPIGVYLPPLYATEMGLGLSTVGFIFMLARIWDVFTDPAMGLLIDRYPSRWGRRKHWIVLGMPIMMLATWFLYMPTREPQSASYLFTWLFVLYAGYTLMDIAHKSWAADLTSQYDDRSRLFGWREIINTAGTVGVLLLPGLLDLFYDADAFDRAVAMGLFLVITLPIAVVIVTRHVPDTTQFAHEPSNHPKDLLIALRNPTIIRILLAECFVAVLPGAAGAMFLFIAQWVFNLEQYGSLGLVTFFISGMLAVPLWVKVSTRFSKHGALIGSVLCTAASFMLFLVVDGSGSVIIFLSLTALVGIGFTGPQVLVRSMVADAVDEETLRSGQNRAGLYYSFMSTVYKLGNALSVGVAYYILDQVGFDPASTNSAGAVQGLLITFVLLPATFAVLTAACMWKYPLSKEKHENIRAQLADAPVTASTS
jgi:glycoside/pentoside/hexuronide:cation symporter, GPH family